MAGSSSNNSNNNNSNNNNSTPNTTSAAATTTTAAPSLALVAAAAAAACAAQPHLAKRLWERAAHNRGGATDKDVASPVEYSSTFTSSTLLEDCLLQVTLTAASVASLWGCHSLWRQQRLFVLQQQQQRQPRHPAALMLSPTEAKVQALLQGDLSHLESSLDELHQKVAAVTTTTTTAHGSHPHTTAHSTAVSPPQQKSQSPKLLKHNETKQAQVERQHRCPEYEHFRAVMRAKRKQRHTHSVADDDDDDTDTNLTCDDDNMIEARTSPRKDSLPSEYTRFRSVMHQRRLQQKQQALRRLLESTTSMPRSNNNNHDLETLMEEINASQHTQDESLSSCFFLFDNPKTQLGQVRDLLGTVLGKAPPSPSPFFVQPRRRRQHRHHSNSSSRLSTSGDSVSCGHAAADFLAQDEEVEIVFDD